MAKRKRNQASEVPQVVEFKEEIREVTYKEFFQACRHRGLLKHWQEKEVQAFFRSLGLKDKEPTNRYEEALLKY